MQTASTLFVFAAFLAAPSAGMRGRGLADITAEALATDGAGANATERGWVRKAVRWCLATPERTVSCDASSVIRVRGAWYNKFQEKDCVPPTDLDQTNCDKADATEKFAAKCDGRTECTIKREEHASCSSDPWWMMRLTYVCEAGEGEPDDKLQADVQTLPVPAEKVATAEPARAPERDVKDPSKEAESKQAPEIAVVPELAAPAEVKPKIVKGNAHMTKAIRTQKMQDDLKDPMVTTSVISCYRRSRTEKVLSSFTGWNLDAFSRLTNCAEHEGCFKLNFPGGKVYTDPDTPPTDDEILSADVEQGDDSLLITFAGMGLVRNDQDTWGICLPKNSGAQIAIELFKSLKLLPRSKK